MEQTWDGLWDRLLAEVPRLMVWITAYALR